jgi:hypothetical protein
MKRISLALIVFVAVIANASPALWQYNVPSSSGKAFLWIPPSCETVRGLLVMGQLAIEGELIGDPEVRKSCTESDIGIVYFQPHVSGTFLYWTPGNTDTQTWLAAFDDLAKRSGHPEIRRVPWITAGHSTAGIYCRNVAYWQPTRVAGVFHIKSGNFHQPDVLPPNASFAGVPLVALNGQLETFGPASGIDPVHGRETQWIYVRKDLLKFRAANPQYLVSELVHPGDDHFHGAPEVGGQLALFLRKVAQHRLPKSLPPGNSPVACLVVKAEDGWLTDADIEAPGHPAAAYADYTGGKTNAMWHFDREMAEATLRFNHDLTNHQCLSNPECVWMDDGDGWTFKASARWLDVWPEKFGGRMQNQKIGHSDTPFVYRGKQDEPVRQIGPDTFRVLRLPTGRKAAINIAAFHPGDARYRATTRWGGPSLPAVRGQTQTIDFPTLADLKPGQTIALAANASSGLPIYYEVDYGPVAITDSTLTVADLPTHPRFPIECKITAYQIGRRTEPVVQSADPVSAVFQVKAP